MRRKLIIGSTAIAAVVVGLTASALPASAAGNTGAFLAANGKTASSAAVKPQVAPVSRDSSLRLSDMTWATWSKTATGTGVATINLCDPDCAHGKAADIPVNVTLATPQHVCGGEFYTEMKLAFTATPPAGLPQTTSVPVAPTC
ncbi:hypothetical protein [Hamadaea tsunoensis]|uniref:hypothetical protein n=1 Tax=Hamadaea tsunoensis TaxID=53368 RepID=UPI00040A8DEA|nr:hypothetical protein [Hamadaea tsunoensis]